jgi:glycosyltransferase involved in cell wall biosynthesis
MIVFVNAISIKEGGSLVVLHRLLEEMLRLRSDVTWHVAACMDLDGLQALNSARLTTWIMPWTARSALHVKFWYEWKLLRLVREVGADVIFSLTNYLSHRNIPVPSLLLVQHAGHFSETFKRLTEQRYPHVLQRAAWRLKTRWVRSSVKRACLVTVQTEALAKALIEETGIPESRIVVVPHGQGLIRAGRPREYPGPRCWRIGYLTKFGVQKNFEVLFRAVRVLVERNTEIRLVLTLRRDIPEFAWVAAEWSDAGIAPWVENHGEIAPSKVQGLCESLDLSIFPSLCESFGFPLVEAMACGLPVLVAETKSNRELAASAARYFASNDHVQLANIILELIRSKPAYEAASLASLRRAEVFSWEQAATQTLAALTRCAGTTIPKPVANMNL